MDSEGVEMALNFGGTSQYVEIPDSISLRLSGQCFMSSWVYINSFPASNKYSSIIVKKYDGSKIGYFLDIYNSSGTLKLRVGSYQNANYATVWDITGWNTEEWNWISGGYDGSNWNLYFNEEMKSQTSQGTGAISTSLPVNLGCTNLNGTYDRFLNGMLFDTRIYNRYPSANEIAEIYHKRGADRVCQGLVGQWRLDELPSGITGITAEVAPHNMTANDSPAPYKASASSEYSADRKAYKAFDGTNGVWGAIGTSGWLKLDYGDGNAPVLKGYAIKSYEDPKYQTVMPKNWTFKGSNDNSNWTTLDTRTNITGWTTNEWREFWFDNTTGYRYYMIDISANNGHSTVTYIAEMEHFTTKFQALDLSGNENHGTPHGGIYRDSPHRLRRGVLVS